MGFLFISQHENNNNNNNNNNNKKKKVLNYFQITKAHPLNTLMVIQSF